MLIPLRHLGIDWQIAAKWFSVLDGHVTVVPLWAWLRRMFDDRTGAAGLPGLRAARQAHRHFAVDHPRLDVLVPAGDDLVLPMAADERIAPLVAFWPPAWR